MRRGYLQLSDICLAYVDFGGDGPGLLMLHGLMGRASTWESTAEWLKQYYHVIALDQRGHGWSGKPDNAYSNGAYVNDAIAVIEALRLAPAVIIGHSMGAVNTWVLAAQRPDLVRGIVLEDKDANMYTATKMQNWRDWFASWPVPFQSLREVKQFFNEEDSPRDGEFFIEVMREEEDGYHPIFSFDHMLQTLNDWTTHDYAPLLDKVQCPALVVKGSLSQAKASDLKAMAKRMPQGQYTLVKGAGHVVHNDQPERWRAAVEPFLAEMAVHA